MIHVTNWKYADIGTAVAAADMTDQGMVCKVTNSSGKRLMTVLLDTDDAILTTGTTGTATMWAVAMKIGTDANEIDIANPDGLTVPFTVGGGVTQDRKVKIRANDVIMEVRRGAKIEYSADLVDATLDPARAGTTPAVGDQLGVKGGKWSTFAGATPTGIQPTLAIARVILVFGTNFVIELI